MKKYFIGIFIFVNVASFSQTYFFEDFNYDSFEEIDSLYQNKVYGAIWRTQHALRNVDINENGKIDTVERYKKTSIVEDPFQKGNKIIRFELNKVSPKFYSKYACDDRRSNNVIEDAVLKTKYNAAKDLYCTDCAKDSPLKKHIYDRDVHMKRNEIAITGPSERSLYKPKKNHWFGFKMLLDPEYEIEKVNNGDIVSHFHLSGEGVVSPPIVLSILKDKFYLGITNVNGGTSESHYLGPVTKDKWIDWKFHIRLSTKYRRGIVEVWRDGVKMHRIKGKNTYKDYRMYLKLGIYKYGWWTSNYEKDETKRKVISFDNVWANKKDRFSQ